MGRRGRERGWLVHAVALVVAGWLFSLAYALGVVVVAALTPRAGLWRRRPELVAGWGRTMLRLSRVTLEVEGAERLLAPGPKIVTFNHASILDAYAICALMPPGGVALIKRELLRYPVIGLAAWLIGLVPIDRGHHERARRTMARAAERMKREQLAVVIAPEGTRSRDGRLRPFKKGALHLALATGAPIVPLVIDGSFQLQPRGQWWCRPGRLRARVLPPVDSSPLTREGVDAATEGLRALYLRELARLGGEEVPSVRPLAAPRLSPRGPGETLDDRDAP